MTTPLSVFHDPQPHLALPAVAEDNEAVRIATLAHHAVTAAGTRAAQQKLIAAAASAARRYLSPTTREAGCLRDAGPAKTQIDLLRLLAEQQEGGGRTALAASILEALSGLARLDVVDAARILGDRARLARKQGHLDLARAQYEELLRRGRRMKSAEIQARAWAGFGSLAQVRGNFPEMRRASSHASKLARSAGMNRLAAVAEMGLGVSAAVGGDYSTAIVHLWAGYQLAGEDSRIGPEALGNLAQVLYDCNRPREARSASVAVLHSKPEPRIASPALGLYAMASARLADRAAVDRVAKEAVRLARSKSFVREAAGLLHECALAYELLGLDSQSGVLRRRAHAIASTHGFHDLVFRTVEPAPQRQVKLAPVAESAARAVAAMEEPLRGSELITVGSSA